MFRATAEYTSTSAKNFKDPKSKYFQWIFSELWCVLGINTHLNTQKKGKDFINNLYIDYRLKYFGHIKLKFNIKDNCTFFLLHFCVATRKSKITLCGSCCVSSGQWYARIKFKF